MNVLNNKVSGWIYSQYDAGYKDLLCNPYQMTYLELTAISTRLFGSSALGWSLTTMRANGSGG